MRKIQLTIAGKKLILNFNDHFAHLVNINESLTVGATQNYRKRGLVYVDVPEIVGITGACENVDTLFKVGNRLDLPLFFTQTGQLALEQALQSFSGTWTVIHSGRDEEKEDIRHLRQFRLTEEEFDCSTVGMTRDTYDEDKMYEALLKNIQKTVQSMITQVLKDHGRTLETIYKRNIQKLYKTVTSGFLRITYEDGIKFLQESGYPDIVFGDDLESEHEEKIVSMLNTKGTQLPVFIMKYPKEIKFFNMKVSTKDPRVCLSADLIFPYAGEGTGSSVREHVFKKLRDRLMTSTMYKLHLKRGGKYEDFKWYLDIMEKKATNPHAGYGIGNDRVLQYIFGESDIRSVSIFSLLNRQTGDWDESRYGQAAVISSEKKHVLLSIGKSEDKNLLLPHIRKAHQSSNIIFYATEKTHKFLAKHGILSSLVYKISQKNKNPNIAQLLERKVFNVIINIPTRKRGVSSEVTNGQQIRKGAVDIGLTPITDTEIAALVLNSFSSPADLPTSSVRNKSQ